jgi:hypothetical protein
MRRKTNIEKSKWSINKKSVNKFQDESEFENKKVKN